MKNSRLKTIRNICKFLPPILAQKVRERLMSNREAEKLAMDFKRKSFTGGFLFGNTKDFHAFKFFVHGYFDWRNIVLANYILKIKNGDFIEVGANIGTETVSLAEINTNNKVHAFEPVSENVKVLNIIKEENNFENLLIYDVLVSDRSGTERFKIPPKNDSGTGHITKETGESIKEFQVVSLDVKLRDMKLCSALFIDVEGFEYHVIRGAREIIKKHRPFLILEVNKKYLQQRANVSISVLQKEICQMDYKTFYIGRMGLKEANVDSFVKSNKNWICIPVEELNVKRRLARKIFLNSLNPLISYRIL